jgi:hypothetical protein
MKKILASLAVLAGLIGGIAYAATGANSTSPSLGDITTTPVLVCGTFDFNGGPQISTVNVCGGTFVANSGSAVTVTNSFVSANSVILFGLKTVGGTPAAPFLVTVTPGTGFTVNSAAGDTSTYNYIILG